MPVSLMGNWQKELKKWAPELTVRTFHGTSKSKRNSAAAVVRRSGGVRTASCLSFCPLQLRIGLVVHASRAYNIVCEGKGGDEEGGQTCVEDCVCV